jgi:hypothetical protein
VPHHRLATPLLPHGRASHPPQELISELQDQDSFGKRGEGWTLAEFAGILLLLIPPFTLTVSVGVWAGVWAEGGWGRLQAQPQPVGLSAPATHTTRSCRHCVLVLPLQGLVDIFATLLITAGLVFMCAAVNGGGGGGGQQLPAALPHKACTSLAAACA